MTESEHMPLRYIRARALARGFALLALAAACALSAGIGGAGAASSSVTVTLNVGSVTVFTPNCSFGSPSASFGTVLPGDSRTTTSDCRMTFGSTNDTSMLRAYQRDRAGKAMYQHTTGFIETTWGTGGYTNDWQSGWSGRHLDIQSDGKFIVSSWNNIVAPCNGADVGMSLSRFTAAGVLDGTYGTGGRKCVDPTAGDDWSGDFALQSDDKAMLASYSNTTGNYQFMRLDTTGNLDPACNGGAVVNVNSAGWGDEPIILPSANGQWIWLLGTDDSGGDDQVMLGRFLASNCSADASFAAGGLIYHDWSAGAEVVHGAVIQPDGKIVVVGETDTGPTQDVMVARYDTNGSPDLGFGVGGLRSFSVSASDDRAWAVTLDDNNNIIVGGSSGNGAAQDSFVARITSAGNMDNSFGTSGVTAWAYDAARLDTIEGVATHPDGTIIAVGWVTDASGDNDATLAHILDNGGWDTYLDTDGRKVIAQSTTNGDAYNDVEIGTDGTVWTAGVNFDGSSSATAIARLRNNTVNDYDDPGNKDWGTAGASHFGICLSAVTNGTADWASSAGCPMTDGAYWRAVPTATSGAAPKVAHGAASVTNVIADLRFGVRNASNQAPGYYLAPMTFEVVAPNV